MVVDVSALNDNKGIPALRESDLTEDSNRFDKNLAAPSDAELRVYWSVWAAIAWAAGLFTLVVFLGVVSSRKARQQTFNCYLIYLMIPDVGFSLLCGTTCLLNAIKGSYWSHWMCNFQQWYCIWGIGSNCWLNALITQQLHLLLRSGHQGRRYTMPTRQTVTYQAIGVYLYCAFLGTWGLIDKENFPYYAHQVSGLACIPVEVNFESSLFFWLFFMPIFSLIPIFYVLYVSMDICLRKLLPSVGKRRLLAIYFGRIVLVFLVMWGPYFLLTHLLATVVPTWVIFVGAIFSHIQGPLSAGVSLLKPDIWFAVHRFITCKCCDSTSDQSVFYYNQHNQFQDDETSRRRSIMRRLSQSFRTSVFGLPQPQQTPTSPMALTEQAQQHQPIISYASVWPNEDGDYTSSDEEDFAQEGAIAASNVNTQDEGVEKSARLEQAGEAVDGHSDQPR